MDAYYCNVAIATEVAYKIGNGIHNESEYGCGVVRCLLQ